MKKMLFIVMATLCLNSTFAQQSADAIQTFFKSYADDDSFTSVQLCPKLFEIASQIDIDDADMKELKSCVSNVKYITILTKENKNAAENKAMYQKAMQTINAKDYSPLFTVKDAKDNVQFLTKEKNGVISELFMVAGTEDDFVLLSMVGDINLKQISKLSNSVKTEGMEHLKKLEQKN